MFTVGVGGSLLLYNMIMFIIIIIMIIIIITINANIILLPFCYLFREISQTTVSTRWPKPKCTIPAWPSQFKIVGC